MSPKWMFFAACCTLTIAGCGSSSEYETYEEAPLSENVGDGHDHHHEGAHGGQVIEFDAAHAHHAELVFDEESRDITLYFYGAKVGEPHPATGVVFELEEGEDELHLEVTESPLEGETDETASRFVVAGSEVPEDITSVDGLHGHFHVTIDGQDYKGSFGGDHDHGEHGEHDDDDEHDEDGEHAEGEHAGDDDDADGSDSDETESAE